jgi:hypothetical protein
MLRALSACGWLIALLYLLHANSAPIIHSSYEESRNAAEAVLKSPAGSGKQAYTKILKKIVYRLL